MAHILSDRVKETTTTTGTGAIALGGAVANFRDFDTLMANTDTTNYAIVHRTANEWEVGRGTWNTGNTLSRTSVSSGTNGTSAVNLSAGTKDVFMTLTPNLEWPALSLGALGVAGNQTIGGTLAVTGNVTGIGGSNPLLLVSGATSPWVDGLTTGTSKPALSFVAGTLMTTSSDGAIEADATNFYGTTDTGNRGIFPTVHFIRANAVRTYTSNTSAQAIFNDPANGRLTLETGTYRFHGVLSYSAMSATSGNRNFNPVGAGTAVTTGVVYAVGGADTAVATVLAGGFSHNVALASTTSAVPATVAVGAIHVIDGSLEVTTAGTIIPSTTMVTAAASTLAIGSFLEFWRIGTDAVVSVGQWD